MWTVERWLVHCSKCGVRFVHEVLISCRNYYCHGDLLHCKLVMFKVRGVRHTMGSNFFLF